MKQRLLITNADLGERGTVDLIFGLRQLAEKTLAHDSQLYPCFIDLSKAFDTVPKEKIWRILQDSGVDKSIRLTLKLWHWNTETIH